VLGARDTGLDAGYHLIAIAPGSDARLERVQSCKRDAEALAVERYNDEHGTTFTAEQLRFDACGEELVPCEDGSFCGSFTEPCPAAAVAAFDTMGELIRVELDCPMTLPVLTPVADPERERVAVRIGTNLEPLTVKQQEVSIEEAAGVSTDVPVPADAGSGMAQ
jgi:hypothetical protein